jgi:glutaredoxin
MKHLLSHTVLGALLATGALQCPAQTVYKIVGADGRVSFSDKPPVAADNVTATNSRGQLLAGGGSTSMPYELRQVANRYPVTLYTADNCNPCGTGRALLVSRGIPFSERTVNTMEDGEALQRVSGENSLPFLMVGGQKIKGFSDSEWSQFLDAAGYPKTSLLPSSYRYPPATPLVTVQKPAALADGTAGKKPGEAAVRNPEADPSPAPRSNPAGITF